MKKNEGDIYELIWKETLSGRSKIQISMPRMNKRIICLHIHGKFQKDTKQTGNNGYLWGGSLGGLKSGVEERLVSACSFILFYIAEFCFVLFYHMYVSHFLFKKISLRRQHE